MEIRGHQYKAAQGVAVITNSSAVIIPGITGKTLYLNYMIISISDSATGTLQLTDGDGGTIFWKIERGANGVAQPSGYILNYGDYGSALTEGNGLFGITSTSNMDYTITALGYYK